MFVYKLFIVCTERYYENVILKTKYKKYDDLLYRYDSELDVPIETFILSNIMNQHCDRNEKKILSFLNSSNFYKGTISYAL